MRRLALLALCTAACGTPQPRAATDSVAADSAAAPLPPGTPALVIGNRYETQAGSLVCPTADAMRRLMTAAQSGDANAFTKTVTDANCSPVVPGALVTVAEQQGTLVRVQRANDAATYWMVAEKLTPRGQ